MSARYTPAEFRALWIVAALATAACAPADDRVRVTVLAASSLTDAFLDLERRFEAEHPDIDIAVSTAGSQILHAQIEQGIRADLFASAHQRHLAQLSERGHILEQSVFARSQLAVAVPRDNPADIETLADLARAQRLVIGAPEVPIGAYTEALFAGLGKHLGANFEAEVRARVVSREHNVRLVRAKVAIGEADAAIVYATDVPQAPPTSHTQRAVRPALGAADLRAVTIPREVNPVVSYYLALLADAPQVEQARQFQEFLTSPVGRDTLRAHGFAVP